MKFKSNAKYNEEPETGSIFALKYNSLRIVIRKYVGYGDTLFLNCSVLGIYNYDLGTEDFDEAVNKAKEYVEQKTAQLKAYVNELKQKAMNAITSYATKIVNDIKSQFRIKANCD